MVRYVSKKGSHMPPICASSDGQVQTGRSIGASSLHHTRDHQGCRASLRRPDLGATFVTIAGTGPLQNIEEFRRENI